MSGIYKKEKVPEYMYKYKEVQKYIDSAVNNAMDRVKSDIVPKIEALDKRDREQFERATDVITAANSMMIKRQDLLEGVVKQVQDEVESFSTTRTEVVTKINENIVALENKFNQHLTVEMQTLETINKKLEEASKDRKALQETLDNVNIHGTEGLQRVVKEFQDDIVTLGEKLDETSNTTKALKETLDSVSANGNKGLQPSIKDLYSRSNDVHSEVLGVKGDIQELRTLVQPKLDRGKWWEATKQMFRSTRLFGMLNSKLGLVFFIFLVITLINILTHVFFGYSLISLESLTALVTWIARLFK